MKIKQGDKVRVSKDVPKLIFGGCDMSQIVCTVCCVDKDVAAINMTNDERTEMKVWIVPTKYLVKVDAEAKGAKFKVGDKVRVKDIVLFEGCVFPILDVEYREKLGWQYELNIHEWYAETDIELYTKLTEADAGARIRQMEAELDEFRKAELDRILHPEKYYTYEVAIDNVAMNWQRYEADLAKELAISYAKLGKSPLDAVAAAKEITKRLKQK